MEISQLRTFYEIVKSESYSKASKNLFITQSAVSHQIRNLEEELNMQLFERLGKKMKLTDGGETLINAVKTFLDDLDNLKRISADILDAKVGSLTISVTNGMMVYILPDIIRKFKERFPQIKFKLLNRSLPAEFLPLVSNGEIDLAIGGIPKQIYSNKVNFLLWKSFGMILLMNKNHPLSKRKTIKLADISEHPLILNRRGVTGTAVCDTFTQHKLPYEIIMEIDGAEIAKRYIQMGIGISIIPSFMLTSKDSYRFSYADVTHLFGKVDYGIYYNINKYITSAMKQFVKCFAPYTTL